jgi:hypothetical protein
VSGVVEFELIVIVGKTSIYFFIFYLFHSFFTFAIVRYFFFIFNLCWNAVWASCFRSLRHFFEFLDATRGTLRNFS